MADTIELTGTLEDYRSKVEELNTALDQLDSSSQEYKNTLAELQQLNTTYAESLGTSTEKTNELSTVVEETTTKASDGFNSVSTAISGAIPMFGTFLNAWKGFQAAMMANPWVAVLTVALGALVALFNTFKNAINSNEETSMKWKKAMSTLQPIINLIKNAIDKLVTAFVDMVSWIMSKVPDVTRMVANGIGKVLGFIADILDGITWIPKQIASMISKVIPMVADGVKKILTPVKWALNAVGLDEWVAKIDNAINNVSSSVSNAAAGIANGLGEAGNAVRNIASKVGQALYGMAAQMEHSRNLQQKENELAEDTRNLNEDLAASYERTAEARNKLNEARAKGNTEEALKYEKQMEEEAHLRAEKTLAVEKKRLDYMESMAKLTANSAKDNDAISQQRVKVMNAETKAYQELAQATKQRIKLEKDLERAQAKKDKEAEKAAKKALADAQKAAKQAEAARKKELAEAEKAAALADKEAEKKSKETTKQYDEQVAAYKAEYKEFKDLEERKLKLREQLNIVTKKDRQNYEQERYKEEMEMHKKTIDSYLKLIDDANVLEADKNKYRLKLNEALAAQMSAKIQHDINMAKIDADELAKYIAQLENRTKQAQSRAASTENNRYIKETQEISAQYEKREINAKEYQKRMEEANKTHQENLKIVELAAANERAENAKKATEEYVKNIQERYGNLETLVKQAEQNLKNIENEEAENEEPNEERIEAARRTYETLQAIYEQGENGITDIINNLMNARQQFVETGSLDSSLSGYIEAFTNALQLEDYNPEEHLNEMLLRLAETLGLNLDDMTKLWDDYYNKTTDANAKANELRIKQNDEAAKHEVKQQEKNIKSMQKVTSQMAKTMGAVSDYWQQSIEQRLEAGEISQEQAEAEFENLKKFNIAQAVVDTLAGALSSQMSVWKEPSLNLWAKIAMSALLGIETLASGWAQINQIKAQTLGSAGGASGGAAQPNIIVGTATPILNEAQDINNLNAMNAATSQDQSDTRVYVLESDITDAQNRTKVRVQESTF